jgi:hypothetical protein
MSDRNTTIAMSRGGQQPVVVGGCTVVAYWHLAPALLITAAIIRHVRPLPATVALS